ncbi:PilZ domain-containing protein [Ammoniphilus sp. CFH 90114]|uniref:PilZ domain-containing protein n=1 Tax=Ammoniphilus sp. CFH 90114 TaxID=2493665 RepID=UPI00100E5836|nr:PilZ domain-containing protein [Ammoniphilus sp. CFH 90114]RXT06526.1 PilZ domain-containing protein [Ammoniphilus sp. CFH 90114]
MSSDGIYRRQEGFRFVFNPPIIGSFQLTHIQGVETNSDKWGFMSVLDISLSGAKLATDLDFPHLKSKIVAKLKIHEHELNLIGDIVWKKKGVPHCLYGIKFTDASYKERIFTELKGYRAEKKNKHLVI